MEKFSKIIVPAIIGLSAVGALYVCCTHTLSRRSRAAQIDMPSTPSLPEVRRARLIFAGDLMQHTPQLTAARTPEGDFDFNASFIAVIRARAFSCDKYAAPSRMPPCAPFACKPDSRK